jgi:hypothetical protein
MNNGQTTYVHVFAADIVATIMLFTHRSSKDSSVYPSEPSSDVDVDDDDDDDDDKICPCVAKLS